MARALARGSWLRRVVLGVAVLVVVALTGAAVSWWQVRDLRDLAALERTEARVTGEDLRRRLPDLVEVRFTDLGGGTVEASIPGDSALREGDTVEVAYVPDDPARVRLVDGWEPAHETWLVHGALAVLVMPLAALRRGTREGAQRAGLALRRRVRGA